MKRTSIQTLFGNAAAFSSDLCLQVHRPRPDGSVAPEMGVTKDPAP